MARRPKSPTTHWVWSDYGTRSAYATEVRGLTDGAALRILRGQRLPRIPRGVKSFALTRPATRDVVGLVTGDRCVSIVLRRVLAKADAEIQWIPISIAGRRYSIPNALDHVPAIDLERSQCRTFVGGGISKVERLVPRAIPLEAPELFHTAEITTLLVVGDALKRRLEAASKSPGMFTPLEDYRNEY